MFSRNLYEIEEVAILLFQSIQGKRKTEASFWAHELYISLETKLLKDVLNFCAILFAPTYAIYNYTKFAKTVEDFEHMINVLCYCSNKQTINDYNLLYSITKMIETRGLEHSSNSLIKPVSNLSGETRELEYSSNPLIKPLSNLSGETKEDEYKTEKVDFDTSDYEEDVQELLEICIKKKQYIRCASLFNTFGVELFDIQEDFKQLYKEIPKNQKKFVIHAITRWLINKDFIDYKEIPTYNWERWTKIQGTKEARLIAINPICLKTWINRPNSTHLIGDPMKIFENGSKYFKQFDLSDSDELENIFFEVFKDDIPDEWSNEERKKSHFEKTINTSFNEFALILQTFF
jgi:hypothetical protein